MASGHEVLVLTGFPHYPEWKLRDGYSGWRRREIINGVNVHRLRHFIPSNPTSLARLLMELSFGARLVLAKWGKPDVILIVSPALFSSGMALVRSRLGRRQPAVAIWVQDLYSRGLVETESRASIFADLMKLVEGEIFRQANGVVAIHERFREFIEGPLRVPGADIAVIRNWTHLSDAPPNVQFDFRRHAGCAPDDVLVLHAGNMGKKQGLENVVAAARLADARKSHVRFILMGDGNQRRQLEALAKGVRRIRFLDAVPGSEFQSALAAADILLVNELPGLKDMAVPSKLTSYFNSGVPVLAATDRLSVTASEIEASGGGVRVDAADPEALLDQAESLAADPVFAKELGLRGREFKRASLSEAAAIRRYDEFITSLAMSPRR